MCGIFKNNFIFTPIYIYIYIYVYYCAWTESKLEGRVCCTRVLYCRVRACRWRSKTTRNTCVRGVGTRLWRRRARKPCVHCIHNSASLSHYYRPKRSPIPCGVCNASTCLVTAVAKCIRIKTKQKTVRDRFGRGVYTS